MIKRQINYRGYIIVEENKYLVIYKNHNYISKVEANWIEGLATAKSKIDKVNSLFIKY